MHEEIRQHNDEIAKRYVGSARYTLEVDYKRYAQQLRADIADQTARLIG
jgi:hypothetical protein